MHLKGSTWITALAFIEGTNVVTKHQVCFFLNSGNPRFLFLIHNFSFTLSIFRNSRLQMFFKIGTLKNFAIFRGKHLCWSLSLHQFLEAAVCKCSSKQVLLKISQFLQENTCVEAFTSSVFRSSSLQMFLKIGTLVRHLVQACHRS